MLFQAGIQRHLFPQGILHADAFSESAAGFLRADSVRHGDGFPCGGGAATGADGFCLAIRAAGAGVGDGLVADGGTGAVDAVGEASWRLVADGNAGAVDVVGGGGGGAFLGCLRCHVWKCVEFFRRRGGRGRVAVSTGGSITCFFELARGGDGIYD